MSSKSTAGIMERAVLRRLIDDLGSDNELYFKDAANFLERPEFIEICKRAGYPDTLLDTLKQLAKQTEVQRKAMGKEILAILKSQWA